MPCYTIEIEGEYVYIGVYNLILFLRVLIYRCTMYSESDGEGDTEEWEKTTKRTTNQQRFKNYVYNDVGRIKKTLDTNAYALYYVLCKY